MNLYLKALGAKVGEDALISEFDAGRIDLVSIGAGASLGAKLKLSNARVEGDELIIGTIDIGADAYIGTSCVIENDVVIDDGGALEDLTSLPAGARIGAHEIWNGSPARKTGMVNEAELDPKATVARSAARDDLPVHAAGSDDSAARPAADLPSLLSLRQARRLDGHSGVEPHLLPRGDSAVRLAHRLRAGAGDGGLHHRRALDRHADARARRTYSVWSWFYLRKWAISLATEVTLETLSSLFATLYMRSWYRMMGARIGKDSRFRQSLRPL